MQRQFDMENEQDVKDLFDILPDTLSSIYKHPPKERIQLLHESYAELGEVINSVFKIKWGEKISVKRPVDKSKWIGCLVAMRDSHDENWGMGTLIEIKENCEYPYSVKILSGRPTRFKQCRPIKKEEIKFVEDTQC